MSHSQSSIDSDESASQPPPPSTSKASSNQRRGSLSKVQCTFSYYEPSRHADAKSLLMKRKPAMACLFCRMRKIACAPPVPPETRCKYVLIFPQIALFPSPPPPQSMVTRRANQPHYDALCLVAHRFLTFWLAVSFFFHLSGRVTHSQCARREINCEYPKESKRGQYRRQQYLERVGKEVAEKIAEVERLAADVERTGGIVSEVPAHVGTGRSVSGRNRRLSSASQPY